MIHFLYRINKEHEKIHTSKVEQRQHMTIGTAECVHRKHLPNDIPVGADGTDLELLGFEDVLELTSNFAGFSKKLWVKKVLHRPIVSVPNQMDRDKTSIAVGPSRRTKPTSDEMTHPLLFH